MRRWRGDPDQAGEAAVRTVADYCGYCGTDFRRAKTAPVEICPACLADPQTAATYQEDNAIAEAEAANDLEESREAWAYEDHD